MADGATSCTLVAKDRQRPIPRAHVIIVEPANQPTLPHLELGPHRA
jgi:hypothetical protein